MEIDDLQNKYLIELFLISKLVEDQIEGKYLDKMLDTQQNEVSEDIV